MRGRTLCDAFIILDEAQNTSPSSSRCSLRRFGASSKMVVNGDDTQIDLPRGQRSGLLDVERLFDGWRTSGSSGSTRTTSCATRSSAASSRRTTARRASASAARARRVPVIYLDNRRAAAGLDTRALVRVLERLLAQIGEDGTSVSLTFVRDPAMRALNRDTAARMRRPTC